MIKKGFSIIELIMLMVIMGIIMAAVLSIRSSPSANRINAARKKIASDIRYMQNFAVSYQKKAGITFNTTTESYSAYYEQTPGNWTAMTEPLTRKNYTVSLVSGGYSGVDIVSTNFNAAGNGIAFDASGSPYGLNPSTYATTALSAQGSVTLSGSNTVTVEPNTGKVSF